MFSDPRSVQKRATKSDASGHCLLSLGVPLRQKSCPSRLAWNRFDTGPLRGTCKASGAGRERTPDTGGESGGAGGFTTSAAVVKSAAATSHGPGVVLPASLVASCRPVNQATVLSNQTMEWIFRFLVATKRPRDKQPMLLGHFADQTKPGHWPPCFNQPMAQPGHGTAEAEAGADGGLYMEVYTVLHRGYPFRFARAGLSRVLG